MCCSVWSIKPFRLSNHCVVGVVFFLLYTSIGFLKCFCHNIKKNSNIYFGKIYLSRKFIVDHPTVPVVVYVVCKITSAVVLWKSEFNGGSNQEFYVQHWRISQSSHSMLSPSIPDPGVTADLQYTVNNLVPETLYILHVWDEMERRVTSSAKSASDALIRIWNNIPIEMVNTNATQYV
jgi:hypothetical protein